MYSRCEPAYLVAIKRYSRTKLSKRWFSGLSRSMREIWLVKMGFAPLCLREIYLDPLSDRIKKCMAVLGLSVNQGFRIMASRKRGQLGARPNIVRQTE
jgi:hypothetical protein